jgi:hypothetical protein
LPEKLKIEEFPIFPKLEVFPPSFIELESKVARLEEIKGKHKKDIRIKANKFAPLFFILDLKTGCLNHFL